MVASKILYEGQYLYGSETIYNQVRQKLDQHDISEKIRLLEERARLKRSMAESSLLAAVDSADRDELMALFYTTEEKEEIF